MRKILTAAALLATCTSTFADTAKLPVSDGIGPSPKLPAPITSMFPTVNIAKAVGWPAGATPKPGAADLRVTLFAGGLDHPRWLYLLPNGDVVVAETTGPDRPEDSSGIRGFIADRIMARAGAGGPSPDRLTLLRDTDHDGKMDSRQVFAAQLHSPLGMALVGDKFYVANTDSLVRFAYKSGDQKLQGTAEKVADLPGGPRNHHWTKSLVASADGSRLYVGVGSNSNAAENGLPAEENRAAILQVDPATGRTRVFASGLRNPVGMAWEPDSGALWVSVNERDEIGSDLVPDYMTSVKDGGFYGFPWSYWGANVDARVDPPNPDMVAKAIKPDYGLGPHTASLGLSNAQGNKLPPRFAKGMFVGQHGSWNRDPPSGYDVIFVPFADGKPSGDPIPVLGGFLDEKGHAMGRPVGVAIDSLGGLLVADDVGGVIWRVSATEALP